MRRTIFGCYRIHLTFFDHTFIHVNAQETSLACTFTETGFFYIARATTLLTKEAITSIVNCDFLFHVVESLKSDCKNTILVFFNQDLFANSI